MPPSPPVAATASFKNPPFTLFLLLLQRKEDVPPPTNPHTHPRRKRNRKKDSPASLGRDRCFFSTLPQKELCN